MRQECKNENVRSWAWIGHKVILASTIMLFEYVLSFVSIYYAGESLAKAFGLSRLEVWHATLHRLIDAQISSLLR